LSERGEKREPRAEKQEPRSESQYTRAKSQDTRPEKQDGETFGKNREPRCENERVKPLRFLKFHED
jgi:hypothetical protein